MKSNLKFFKKKKFFAVDKFFQNILYNKKNGYYATKQPFGEKGDFITAPNISNLFSEIIAIWMVSSWHVFGKPKNFNIGTFITAPPIPIGAEINPTIKPKITFKCSLIFIVKFFSFSFNVSR